MANIKRIFLIVLDSLGIGYQPDAERFGDTFADTMRRISSSAEFKIPNLISMGLGNIDGLSYLNGIEAPSAMHLRLREVSSGKDTTTGHFELMGIISEKPMPTYKDGFPKEIIDEFEKRSGKNVLCNKPYSGTDVIRDYGKEHLESGALIVYTSADSVFQIAAHEDIVPIEELYSYCTIARELLVGEHAVGRVIARPFIGKDGAFVRTDRRRDFSVKPPARTALDCIKDTGLDVIAIGKITDIFAGVGITRSIPSHSNKEGMEILSGLLSEDFRGLAFANLVDFDMLYGHRQDTDGYAKALSEFDLWLGEFIKGLSEEDALMITADHGCDPGDSSTDHTREYVPCLIYGKRISAENLGTQIGFNFVGNKVKELLSV